MRGVVLASFLVACGPSASTDDGGADASPDASADVVWVDTCGSCDPEGGAGRIVTVLNAGGTALTSFPSDANGNVAPISVVSGAQTGLSGGAVALATDGVGDVYVATQLAILVFPRNATGNVAPARTIAGPNALPTTDQFAGLAVAPDGTIYATSELTSGTTRNPKILVFAPNVNGNAAPTRTITGPTTTMSATLASALSTTQIAEADGTQNVLFFDATASGDVAPQRSFKWSGGLVVGASFDWASNVYLADWNFSTSSVLEYAPTAQGAATPIATIAGATTKITDIGGVALEGDGTIYVANADPAGSAVLAFVAGANGNVAPLRTIAGASTQLSGDASQGPMPLVVH